MTRESERAANKFMSSPEFLTGAFLSFVFTTIYFTFIITYSYTSNELLEHSGFYKGSKLYYVSEKKCSK